MRKGKRKQLARRPSGAPGGNREDLKSAPRALVEPEDVPRRRRREPAEDASVEDPLRDWPEE